MICRRMRLLPAVAALFFLVGSACAQVACFVDRDNPLLDYDLTNAPPPNSLLYWRVAWGDSRTLQVQTWSASQGAVRIDAANEVVDMQAAAEAWSAA